MDATVRDNLLGRIRGVVGDRHAFADPYEMRLYQYDASPETALPDIVVIPGTAKEVAQVVMDRLTRLSPDNAGWKRDLDSVAKKIAALTR